MPRAEQICKNLSDKARVFFGLHFLILRRPDDPAVGPCFAELFDPCGRDPGSFHQQKLEALHPGKVVKQPVGDGGIA